MPENFEKGKRGDSSKDPIHYRDAEMLLLLIKCKALIKFLLLKEQNPSSLFWKLKSQYTRISKEVAFSTT